MKISYKQLFREYLELNYEFSNLDEIRDDVIREIVVQKYIVLRNYFNPENN